MLQSKRHIVAEWIKYKTKLYAAFNFKDTRRLKVRQWEKIFHAHQNKFRGSYNYTGQNRL